jgi:phage-related protein
MEIPLRTLFYFKHYFQDFYDNLPEKVQIKFEYVLKIIEFIDRVPEKFLKHIEGTKGLYEIRVEVGSDIYRVFCCFDEGRLIVLLNGFQKKSQKTPKNEIELAERLIDEYFEEKKQIMK